MEVRFGIIFHNIYKILIYSSDITNDSIKYRQYKIEFNIIIKINYKYKNNAT